MPSLRPTKNADVDNIQNEDQEHEAFLAREDVSAACSAISDYRGWSNTYCYSYDCNVNPEGYPSEYFEKGLDLARDQMVLALDNFSDADLHNILLYTSECGPVEFGDYFDQPVANLQEIRDEASLLRENTKKHEGKSADASLNAEVPG